ncbi:MAG: hypothetical protein R3F65_33665, partial [bacterium]
MTRALLAPLVAAALTLGCDDPTPADPAPADSSASDAMPDAMNSDAMPEALPDAMVSDAMVSDAMPDAAPPRLQRFAFSADDADPAATTHLGTQQAFRDPAARPNGRLVIHLHGAGAPGVCGVREHGELLAARGFHVFMPCYAADYGVGNCGDAIGACRQEAFEGTDQTDVIAIAPPDAIEQRVVMALRHLAALDPAGDWTTYLDGDAPRYDAIVLSGHSHGASSAALIGQLRPVARVVMLAGPYDPDQSWLERRGVTPIERYYGFTHTGDGQHLGHLAAFEALGLPGD